ncbi:MAG: hypothetical protein P1U68_02945 [Verrucomicrobiales bacterium]|nr:hypothetical protein [Verrucomicrobiales bacterium]
MSENFPEPDLPEDDRELESLLRKLKPSPPEPAFLHELKADLEAASTADKEANDSLKWKRLVPLAFVGLLGMLAYTSYQYGPRLNPRESTVAETVAVSAPATSSTLESSQFVPVSAQGFLINSSSGGVIETEEGPRERLSLEYQDAYHWHDPETGTSIRYFEPRNEEIIIPLATD